MAEQQLKSLTFALRPPSVPLQMKLRLFSALHRLQQNGHISRHRLETPSGLSDRVLGSVTVLVTSQDVEVAQGRGVVCRPTL